MLDRTNHAKLAAEAALRLADKYIPREDQNPREVIGNNNPPEPVADEAAVKSYATMLMVTTPAITSALDALPLLRAFIAENPVFQNAEELQKGGTWIESARRTLAALEDERKPKVQPLNVAAEIINKPYRDIRQEIEGTKETKGLLEILVDRWNVGEAAEHQRREDAAAEATRIAEAAAAAAQALIDQANDGIARAEVGECDVDVGGMVIDAKASIHDANVLNRTAQRAIKNTRVRVASKLGGRALGPRERRVIVIDDPCAAIKAMGGLSEEATKALQSMAAAFEDAYGTLPAGTREDFVRSI
jgi:hypothetical protein